jgi:hypothetical protein
MGPRSYQSIKGMLVMQCHAVASDCGMFDTMGFDPRLQDSLGLVISEDYNIQRFR